MSESSVDKNLVPEYSELINIEDSKSSAEPIIVANNNVINNNNVNSIKNPPQFGEVEMSSVQISTKPAIIPQNVTPVKAIEKQIETRRADGKRRITPMFVPLSIEQER